METGVKRIHVLGIPVDVVPEERLNDVIERLYSLKDHRQIVLLDFHEMMKSRRSEERKRTLSQAALVLPVSRLIVRAAAFLKKDTPPLRRPYPFIIRLLAILEEKGKSVYLLGSTMRRVLAAESSLRLTFPGLQIVGRYAAGIPADREKDIITAIKKASPTLLLAGVGLKGKHLWIARNRRQFSPGLGIWERHCFDVFSGTRAKPNDAPGTRLSRGFWGSVFRPWRFFRVFRYLLFFLLLFIDRIRGR